MDALQLQKSINWKMQSIEEVLVSLEGMVEPPLVEDFICILQKGGRAKNFANAKQVHAHICNNGLEAHKALGKCLIPMFVECGSILDAQRVFDRLVHTDEYAWTSLIQGYNKFGKFHHALHLFEIMQGDYVRPSAYTYVALLKSCTMSKWLERGQELYAEVVKKGYEANIFVGSSLVDMYAKCGLLVDAQEVHDELPSQNVVSWTALIAGYSDQGLDQEVLSCLKQLQLEDVSLDAITSVYTLKSCRSLGALQEGCEIHAEIVKEGLEKDRFVGSSLVYMYAKLGSFAEAREVLDELQVRDVVSWTSLIAGYSENGHGEEALNCWERMQLEVMTLDAVTYVCGLKACGSIRAIDKGQEIHGMLAKEGFERDPYVGSILVDMYARCGLLMEACDVLNELTVRSVVSWNALLAGYAEHGDGDLVLNCLEQMQLDGVVLDAVSFVCGLKSCGSIEAIERGQELHSEISKEGFDTDPFVGSMLVDMYAKCGLLAEAQEVFDTIPVQDVVLWTTLIAGYAEHGFGEKVLNYWDQMQQEGVIPDALMFVCSLKACGSIGVVERGQEMYSEVVKKGFERDLFIGSTLVDMYTQYGSLLEARKVFDDLLVRDAASWTALIVGYAQHGLVEKLENCFEQMQLEGVFPDVSLWNVVISGYGDQGESEKAHQVFIQMQERGLSPNRVTFLSILKACGHAASIDMGNKIHSQIYRIDEAVGIEVVLATALIDMYGKCGSMVDAQRVFDAMWSRDVLSWNALVLGYSRQGNTDTTFHLFKRMMQEGIQPNDVTILSVLTVCSHVGLVDTGQKCFEAMRGEYSIIPTVQHQNCMIDLLCRAGHLDEAVVVLEKMPYEPDVVTCSTLLSACKKWGSVEIGKHAFEHALRLGEKHSAAFTLMSNIYMDYHMETNEAD